MDIVTEAETKDWTEKDWAKFQKWLKGMLEVTDVTVTFTKKDGTERVMMCTLNPEFLPKAEVKEDKATRKKPDDLMVVYDIQSHGWRSFSIKSVKQVQCSITS